MSKNKNQPPRYHPFLVTGHQTWWLYLHYQYNQQKTRLYIPSARYDWPQVMIQFLYPSYFLPPQRANPKPKHRSMKNDVDFTKILDGEKLIGVMNFNNMIPVDESCIAPLNLRIGGNDDAATKNYKKMAAKQLDWCQHNQDAIVRKANKLYVLVQSDKVSGYLKRRCCDFKKLEVILQKWKTNIKE